METGFRLGVASQRETRKIPLLCSTYAQAKHLNFQSLGFTQKLKTFVQRQRDRLGMVEATRWAGPKIVGPITRIVLLIRCQKIPLPVQRSMLSHGQIEGHHLAQ